MTFTAHYIPLHADAANVRQDYYRTIHADNLREADTLARRYQRKGFRLITLVEIHKQYA